MSDAREPSQEQWDNAFEQSHEFAPTPTSWGLFAYSDAPPPVCGSGMGTLQWFRTQKQMIKFIRDYMAWWHPGPSSVEPEDIAAKVQAIVDGFDAESGNLPTLCRRLNKYMTGLWHIEWIGQFRELSEGHGKFAMKLRTDFLESLEAESQLPKRPPAIAKKQLQEFKQYLRDYGF